MTEMMEKPKYHIAIDKGKCYLQSWKTKTRLQYPVLLDKKFFIAEGNFEFGGYLNNDKSWGILNNLLFSVIGKCSDNNRFIKELLVCKVEAYIP